MDLTEAIAGSVTRPAFKRTEIGLVPFDWDVKPLRNISPKQAVGLVINPSTYFSASGTVPMLVGSHITPNRIRAEAANRITEASNEQLAASRLAAGDLVTVRVGEPGITAVVPPELDGCNCASVMIVRQHKSFDPTWLCHVMNSRIGLSQVAGVQYGTAQKQFNISDAINFLYPVPSLREQRAIAEAIEDADALIESLEQLLAKKRQIKQGAMQELLTGKRRLPGFGGKWSGRTLGALGRWYGGTTPSMRNDEYWNPGTLPWVASGDLKSVRLRSTSLSVSAAAVGAGAATSVPANSVLVVARSGILRRHLPVAINTVSMAINQDIKALVPDAGVLPEFVLQALTHFGDEILATCMKSGTTVESLEFKWLRAFSIRVPAPDEQAAIATALADMDAELDALQARLTKARQIKQGMMQELLTGRIRLV